ncbi:MAG: 50S ribosomal protein L10 [Acidimicrobiales bacterium]
MTDTMQSPTGREPRPEKVAVVNEVKGRLQASSAALLTEYRGLKVSELAELRGALTKAGGDFKVYKNTLVRFAVRDLGVDIDEALLIGPTAIAFVEGDAAAVAKALRDFARTNPNLVVKGGLLGGAALSADDARALADLPPREVVLARLAGGLAAPLVGFAGLLQALPRNLAYGIKALIDQGGNPGVAEPPAAEAEAPATESAPEAAADEADAPAADAAPVAEAASGPVVETAPEPETAGTTADAMASPAADAEPEAAPAAEKTTPEAGAAPAADAETTEAAPAAEADTNDTPEEAS